MELERLYFESQLECKADDAAGFGAFEGYASTFGNLDYHNDVVVSGAYKATIKNFKKVGAMPLLWQHDVRQPVGVITEMVEDEKGLLVRGAFADTQAGREAREYLRIKAVRQMSIGFRVNKYSFDDKKGTRFLEDIDLKEVSLVTFPANERAEITRIKSAPQTEREFEKFLREAGFSKAAAKAITTQGFKVARDADLKEESADNLNGRDAQDEAKNGELVKGLAGLSNLIRSLTHDGRNQKHP